MVESLCYDVGNAVYLRVYLAYVKNSCSACKCSINDNHVFYVCRLSVMGYMGYSKKWVNVKRYAWPSRNWEFMTTVAGRDPLPH